MIKKSILIVALPILIIGCKKNGNKGIVKSDSLEMITADNGKADSTISYNTDINGKKSIKTDYVYKATDGTLVKVVFDYKAKTVSIRSNNKTFILNKVESKGNETTYEKMDMKAKVTKDSLILDQGSNIIELAKTKI
ncbi:hypothetical protein PFY12_11385 [Chryseobacterium camelliae]|uniref:Lipoprotein n=1 Tax=Chryseobacterium camelliae TaxID=1265445 RepID=A0ABY7QIZ0_9FLAO|nr:hypothetical protein [Chryseobacterium camelliae]WBV59658.1 hypothetical protein PFY12_11385 [Chryseobacterium camelliae]